MTLDNDKQIVMALGQSLRAARKKNKLTIEQLANQSEVSGITISNIENGKSNPTVSILWKLADTLNINLSKLLGYTSPKTTISRLTDRPFISELESGWLVQPIFQEDNIDVFRVRLCAQSSYLMTTQFKHSTEIITVMKGKLILKVADNSYDLDEYDSINFNSGLPHEYINETSEEILISIVVKYQNI